MEQTIFFANKRPYLTMYELIEEFNKIYLPKKEFDQHYFKTTSALREAIINSTYDAIAKERELFTLLIYYLTSEKETCTKSIELLEYYNRYFYYDKHLAWLLSDFYVLNHLILLEIDLEALTKFSKVLLSVRGVYFNKESCRSIVSKSIYLLNHTSCTEMQKILIQHINHFSKLNPEE